MYYVPRINESLTTLLKCDKMCNDMWKEGTIADYLGITQQSVNRYEKQKFEPDIGTLILLADYFETTVDYLIGHTPSGAAGLELSKEEWALLRDYRGLDEGEKESIRLVIKNYLKK